MKVLAAFLANTVANFLIGLLVAKFLGPEEYGRFALAFAIGVVIQTGAFDWMRLSATRFYSTRVREAEPAIRATLDFAYLATTAAVIVVGGLFLFVAPPFALGDILVALALATAAINGLFDYSTALLRARFEDKSYSRVVLAKNILALALTGGGAFLFHSAGMAIAGSLASLLGAVFTARVSLKDPGASPRGARMATARTLIAYSAPIVAANMLYQSVPLAARALVTAYYGFAETGQFSLAYDLGIRAIFAMGSALDVLLFQIAVAAHERHGAEKGKEQIARNMTIVAAFLLPACAGIWLTMPSIEALIVPPQFRGPFGHYLDLLLPGLFAMGLIQFAINPVFQIEKKTAPLIGAAFVAVVSGLVLAFLIPRGADASSLALAQCGAYVAALVTLVLFAARTSPQWPRGRDLFGALAATGAMVVALHPLAGLEPGILTLLLQVGVGGFVYCGAVLALDIAGLRGLALSRIGPILARARAAL
ncbi:oligosaccharide flippase family protein [Methylosinus sporium]|uniref:Oligosaccharide flippase family protein n=1 Tax=Methylosinus sporium TaxID=428 RepID=A0A549T704_METSR|nr:polysaccharide biosynthesis C-terminal domain-containing protein [Methylosinus sporium]TRL37658.1 oligosaccharide flippase family protein [Methylosinus sporium]